MKSKSIIQINNVSSKASRAKNSVMSNGGKWSPCTTRLMTAEEILRAKEEAELRKNAPRYIDMY